MPARKPTRHQSANQPAAAQGERLQKVMAAAGVGSRRACETLIEEGRVEVDRKVVVKLGTCVDPLTQEIRVDGEVLKTARLVYYAVNKPPGVVSTSRDPEGRPRVIDLLPDQHRLFTVGRLDKASEGLMLLTNDGELANRLAHPRYGVVKKYLVRVAGHPTRDELLQLREGIHLAEAFVRVRDVRLKKRHRHSTDVEIELDEGKNREIRRVLARIGHKVLLLRRIAIGPLKLGDLAHGEYRAVTRPELRQLQKGAQRASGQARAGPKRPVKAKAAKRTKAGGRTSAAKKPRKKTAATKKMAPAKPAAKQGGGRGKRKGRR